MFALAIHGGAGAIDRRIYSEDDLKEYKEVLTKSLDSGVSVLEQQGSSLEAVTQAVQVLEDAPIFNAARGSVFSEDGEIEMDASIMCGRTLHAGGVTQVRRIVNPILAARHVMEATPHCLISGPGAERIAEDYGIPLAPTHYFFTEKRWQQYLEFRRTQQISMDHGGIETGTVGAVAVDGQGNLAAATSTGGMTGKKPGRVSDSSIVGAGTYANNKTCAVSVTGTGDKFLLCSAAFQVHLLSQSGMTLSEAGQEVLSQVKELGGFGGMITINTQGEIFMPFNSTGMFRGSYHPDQGPNIKIF